ncbi:uncharacterized protein C8R40DRAFT_1048104, partial [Lentinula edodes]|uniref:uncharacterized protein n=1 Tax=Lentinula edodes TaxID=5353 RepID=UPI001E8EA3EF
EHPLTLVMVQNLAGIFKEMIMFNEALSFGQPLLKTSQRILWLEHPHKIWQLYL